MPCTLTGRARFKVPCTLGESQVPVSGAWHLGVHPWHLGVHLAGDAEKTHLPLKPRTRSTLLSPLPFCNNGLLCGCCDPSNPHNQTFVADEARF